MKIQTKKYLICFLVLFNLLSCAKENEDSMLEKTKGKNNLKESSIKGTVSKIWNNILPAYAHASEPECSSSKSSGSEVYVELYKIVDTSKLGTSQESSGLKKLCDTDLVAGEYDFSIDRLQIGEAPLKIRVIDNRVNAKHNNKVIITTVVNSDHNINKEKTVQSKLLEKEIKENTLLASELDHQKIDNMLNRFHEQLIDEILSSNNRDTEDLDSLVKMIEVFSSKIEDLYKGKPSDATIEELGGFDSIPTGDFVLSQSEIDALPESDKCYMNAQSEADYMQCDSLLQNDLLLQDQIMNGFFAAYSFDEQTPISNIKVAIDSYLASLDSTIYSSELKEQAKIELLYITKDINLIPDPASGQNSNLSAGDIAFMLHKNFIGYLQSNFQIAVVDIDGDSLYTSPGEVVSAMDNRPVQVNDSMFTSYLNQQQVYDFNGADSTDVANELKKAYGI